MSVARLEQWQHWTMEHFYRHILHGEHKEAQAHLRQAVEFAREIIDEKHSGSTAAGD